MKRAQAATLLDRSGAGRILRRTGRWRGVLVLNYHRVGDWSDKRWDSGVWSASAEQLDLQARTLAGDAEVIPASAIPDVVGAPPGRRVAITFDDGYRDNHDVGLAILRAHGLQASFFVATGFIDRPRIPWWDEVAWMVRRSRRSGLPAIGPLEEPVVWPAQGDRRPAIERLLAAGKTLPPPMTEQFLDDLADATGSGRCDPGLWADRWMTWDMVRALRDGGMGIGGHTIEHPVLTTLDAAGQRTEIAGCLKRLEQELGEMPTMFSYPMGTPGTFDAQTKTIARDAGIRLAFSYYGGVGDPRSFDAFDIPRASVASFMTTADFRALLTAPRTFARW